MLLNVDAQAKILNSSHHCADETALNMSAEPRRSGRPVLRSRCRHYLRHAPVNARGVELCPIIVVQGCRVDPLPATTDQSHVRSASCFVVRRREEDTSPQKRWTALQGEVKSFDSIECRRRSRSSAQAAQLAADIVRRRATISTIVWSICHIALGRSATNWPGLKATPPPKPLPSSGGPPPTDLGPRRGV